jgi:hypothetical protein
VSGSLDQQGNGEQFVSSTARYLQDVRAILSNLPQGGLNTLEGVRWLEDIAGIITDA